MSAKEKAGDRRRDNAAATRAALLAAGRRQFGVVGYEAASVAELCAEAQVTTGALYYHFGDKKGLFAAVAEELDRAMVALTGRAALDAIARGADPWEGFLAACAAFVAAGLDRGGRRIGLIDAPAVLGAEWTAIRERHGFGAMRAHVGRLQAAGLMVAGDPARLSRMILGLLYAAVEATTERAEVPETLAVLHAMLGALKARDGRSA
ncbi:MAG: TetR/AcrR family transcriptional regulator [Ferrovibrionaceae bacterium]